jgi:hypothetical protein
LGTRRLCPRINAMSETKEKNITVSIVPLRTAEVEYFQKIKIPFSITNTSTDQILVEIITLRFQTDADAADVYIEQRCDCAIDPQGVISQDFTISPTPEFLANTNVFDVMVTYRRMLDGAPQEQVSEKHRGSYIIIKPSTEKLGRLFISLKQPEDLKLAKILARLAERAGFEPYLAIHNSQPGVDIWTRIEPELQASASALVLWTRHTIWGEGVQKEIELCRKHGIQDVLLIQEDMDLPEPYRGTGVEYRRFDPDDPHGTFSKVIAAVRKVMLPN